MLCCVWSNGADMTLVELTELRRSVGGVVVSQSVWLVGTHTAKPFPRPAYECVGKIEFIAVKDRARDPFSR